jgi:hypothetical protein
VSPNSRATCKTADCKEAGIKLQKGEIRFGTWVDIPDSQYGPSWAWRHWFAHFLYRTLRASTNGIRGCVTPKVLSNIKNTIDGDMTMMDGYEELPEEWQEKLEHAIDIGHIPDEDWNGDAEYNRPGRVGFRSRARKPKTEPDEVFFALLTELACFID